MMKKQKKFEFPLAILKQVDECSNGGFVLFTFDSQNNPSVFYKFDNTMSAYAIQANIENWIGAMSHINGQNTLQNIVGSQEEE